MKFRADDGRALTVDVSGIGSSVRGGLTPGEGVTVIAHEWTGPTAVRANYVQQDSSDPARGGKTAPATAPANPALVADGLSLPPDHQYERYNASTSAYGKVEASQVPALVKQKVPIYDRTAKVWVLNHRWEARSALRGRGTRRGDADQHAGRPGHHGSRRRPLPRRLRA